MSSHSDPPNPLPRVPDLTDPQHETPLTEDFEPGTANDPPAGSTAEATVTVDGEPVTVPPGSTLLDALEDVETAGNVPALCSYDRETETGDLVGPRSMCRTCMVETDDHGLVPSCSFPAEDGLSVRTDDPEATEARDVNLDLILSNHNLRCTTCGKNGRCELQDTSIENDVEEPRYGVFEERSEYAPLDDTSSVIQIDRNKCILCNRCVEACNDVQVAGVLRMKGQGEDTHIGFQNGAETMADSTCISCGHCATVCPTGSLVEKGLTDSTTIPVPGFNQKNSIGTVIEYEPAETADVAAKPNRDVDDEEPSGVAGFMARAKRRATGAGRQFTSDALKPVEHAAEKVASETFSIGHLFDIATTLADVRLAQVEVEDTTCGYCAVGCRFDLYGKDGEVLGARATDPAKAPANDFSTCVKGKFAYDYLTAEDRLETPLIKEDGEFREATWDEALTRVHDELSRIQAEHGEHSVAMTASSKCTNEEVFLTQKFARQVLGTPHIDNCARLCHSSTVAALKQTVGYGAMTNRIEDIANADCILVSGSNTTESHPVLATQLVQNVRDGAELIVFDPRKVEIAEHADQYVRTDVSSDVMWINGMMRHIIEEDLHDREFIEERTKGFDELKEKVQSFTPERVEEVAGVPPEELKRAAESVATADTCIFGWAMGLSQHAHGTQMITAMADLALITGNLGKPNAGLSPLRGQNNVQGGGGDMGPAPHNLPGYQDPEDDAVLDKFEDIWGTRPPGEIGLYITEMFGEIGENLHGMYVVGENPVISEPDARNVEKHIEDLEFLVVQDLFVTETAEYADVVLPAAAAPETYGTFTNTERRIQLVKPVVDPPGKARTDMDILTDLAGRFGVEWEYDSPAEVMDEINELVPIYAGVTHDRLHAKGDGLQWPVEDTDDPGTPFLYEEAFNFDDGLARLVPADYGDPPEMPDEEYPLGLTTGRVLYHWHTGSMTRRVQASMHHVGESFVEIHPETAAKLDVTDGEYVRVESRRGDIVVKAQVTDRVAPGTVFIPMHFAEGAVNELTQEELDPTSRIPEYKLSSVRIEPVGPDPETETLGDETPDHDVPDDAFADD
ncbi:formate dehydrogenase subunit alpha [Halomarina litorea]|uniref:formate dehydrogenase subunit alpha n=1 Tax=Halomarina litorea TaxID=2961595 RepID=UPI0020C48A9F|nr:formate dehydrogenase subunit alpha [Halomarina sp. BCD28]